MVFLRPVDRRRDGHLLAVDSQLFSQSNFNFWRLGARETLSGVSRASNPDLTGTPSRGSRSTSTTRVQGEKNERKHDKHTQKTNGRHPGRGPDLASGYGPWAKPALGQSDRQDGQSRLVA